MRLARLAHLQDERMGMPAARLGDQAISPVPPHTGKITLGSLNVLTGKKPQARMGDLVVGGCPCTGAIVFGSTTVLVNMRPAARVLDPTNTGGLHPPAPAPPPAGNGVIVLGEMTVLMG